MSTENRSVMSKDRLLVLAHVCIFAVTVVSLYHPLPIYAHLIGMAVPMIYIGAHLSLLLEDHQIEHLEQKEALMFPIIGSFVLFSLYLVYKFMQKEYIDALVQFYFMLAGAISVTTYLSTTICLFLSPSNSEYAKHLVFECIFPTIHIPFISPAPSQEDQSKDDKPSKNSIEISRIDLLTSVISIGFIYWYLVDGHWVANNILGVAFSIQAIQLINIASFSNGAIILVGLFFYDIFWVFGTDVMVTVATSFNAPVKLLFPRVEGKPSLLGLGDIVIPGIFIALMLRFDQSLEKGKGSVVQSRVYFITCLLAYTLGLALTLFIMFAFNHAQPALLYLVPCCLISVLLVSAVRGQIGELIRYNEKKEETVHEHSD